jgi:lipopolysaccharide biosynthesis glycosyltransferase
MREQGLMAKRYTMIFIVTMGCIGFIITSKPHSPTPDAFSKNTTRFALVSILSIEGPQEWWRLQKYISSAEKLAHSFRKHSDLDMVLMVVDNYDTLRKRDKTRLRNSGWSVHQLRKGIVPQYQGWDQMYTSKLFSKLWIWRLTAYEKILYTDLDVLFIRTPVPLFNTRLPNQYPAMVKDSTQKHHCFSSGVMLLQPSEDEYQRLISYMDPTTHKNEQDFLNIFYHGHIVKLDSRFNRPVCSQGTVCLNDMTPTEDAFTDHTVILHFIGSNKPWDMKNCIDQKITQLCLYWKYYK